MYTTEELIKEYLSDKPNLTVDTIDKEFITFKNNDRLLSPVSIDTIKKIVDNKRINDENKSAIQKRKKEEEKRIKQDKLNKAKKKEEIINRYISGTEYKLPETPDYSSMTYDSKIDIVDSKGNHFTRLYGSINNAVRQGKKCSSSTVPLFYTKEECIDIIKDNEYKCSTEIPKQLKNYIILKGWMKEIADLFKFKGNNNKRCIYRYDINYNGDIICYIGLTDNLEKRHKEHLYDIKNKKGKTAVDKFCINNGIILTEPILIADYQDCEIASKLEKEYIKAYREQGYNVENMDKGGSLGGHLYSQKDYTYEECIEDAKNYKNRSIWYNKSYSVYAYAKKQGWLKEITYYMLRHVSMKWYSRYTKELGKRIVKEEYIDKNIQISYKEFCEREPEIANTFSRKDHKGWQEDICGDYFKKFVHPHNYTKEETVEILKTIKHISDIPHNVKVCCTYYKITPSDYIKKDVHTKAVIQLDKDGNYICEYPSITEAAILTNNLGSHITRACQENKTAGGFKWKYKE